MTEPSDNRGPNRGRDEKGRYTEPPPSAFKPGQSGNPKGRPPGPSITSEIRRALSDRTRDGREKAAAIADTLVNGAIRGNTSHIRIALEYTEGRPQTLFSFEHGIPEDHVRALIGFLSELGLDSQLVENLAEDLGEHDA